MKYHRTYKNKESKVLIDISQDTKEPDLDTLTIIKNIGFLPTVFDIECHGSHTMHFISVFKLECKIRLHGKDIFST